MSSLTEEAEKLVHRIIKSIAMVDDETLRVDFTCGSMLSIRDDGQFCCERRYMVCDEPLEHYVGARFLSADIADGSSTEAEYGDCHEIEFLYLRTSKGDIDFANHNEHNGYYGGFHVVATVELVGQAPEYNAVNLAVPSKRRLDLN